MLVSSVIVVLVSCVVSGTGSVVDVGENDILSAESYTRTKKSPDVVFGQKKKYWKKEDKARTWNDSPNLEEESGSRQNSGEVSDEMTALLAEDVREKLEDLRELEIAYKQLESESISRKILNNKRQSQVNESLNPEMKSFNESKILDDKVSVYDKDSIRTARQYNQVAQDFQSLYTGGLKAAESAYSNMEGYQGLPQSSMNLYGDRGDPYLAQFDPTARTYGAAGIEGNFRHEEKPKHESALKPLKQLKQIIPNVINTLAEITAPVKPIQSTYSGNHEVKKPEYGGHKPHQLPISFQKLDGKKPKGLIPIFFSKQLIFGIGTDKKLNTKHYGSALPEEHIIYPAHSYYPSASAYSYYSPASYWGPLRDDYPSDLNVYPEGDAYYPTVYSVTPEAQNNYDPTLSPYSQGNAYIEPPNSQVKTYLPVDSNYRSVSGPYYIDNTKQMYRNDKNNINDSTQQQLLMEKSILNRTTEEVELWIQKLKNEIESLKVNLGFSSKNATSAEKEETEPSKSITDNPNNVSRRHANNEEPGNNNKVKLYYRGKLNEKTGQFDFEEMV